MTTADAHDPQTAKPKRGGKKEVGRSLFVDRISSASPQLVVAEKGEEVAGGGMVARGKWGAKFWSARTPPGPGAR
jgi:hypothetical protein